MAKVDALPPASTVMLTPVSELANAARAYLAAEVACDAQAEDEAARSEAEQLVEQTRRILIAALGRIERAC